MNMICTTIDDFPGATDLSRLGAIYVEHVGLTDTTNSQIHGETQHHRRHRNRIWCSPPMRGI